MADISQFKDSEGSVFNFKDASIRNQVNGFTVKELTSEDNIDTVYTDGIYAITAAQGTYPSEDMTYSQMLVMHGGASNRVVQLLSGWSDDYPAYIRYGNVVDNTEGAWTSWHKIITDNLIPVTDVTVGGTSILDDSGVANVKFSSGLSFSSSTHNVTTSKATTAQITARSSNYQPIVPSNLNAAVTAVLTDDKAPTFTDDQKNAACSLFGIALTDNATAGIDVTVGTTTKTVATETSVEAKQDKLTAGDNITISDDNVISATSGTTVTMVDDETAGIDLTVGETTKVLAQQSDLNNKQDVLTAGDNITITNNTISADKGSVVTMADNSTAGVDLTVDGTKKTLAKETDLSKYLPLTGGTLTGALYVKDSAIRIKNSTITKGTAPSANKYAGIQAIDSNSNNNGRLWNLEATYTTGNANKVSLSQYTNATTNTVGSQITLEDDTITLKTGSDSCSFSEGVFGIGNTTLYDGCLKYNSSSRLCLAGKAIDVNNAGRTAYAAIYASAFTVSSSEKVKTNIQDLTEEEAKKILNIRPVSFDYKDFYGGSKGKRGVIAEEVLQIIPSVVTIPDDYNEDDFDETKGIQQSVPGVDYASFVPYLIKMVQIQQKQIDGLISEIEELNT